MKWPGEVCKLCMRRSPIGFDVPGEVWAAVMGDEGTVACPTCFDERAQERGATYSFEATYPVTWSDWGDAAEAGR